MSLQSLCLRMVYHIKVQLHQMPWSWFQSRIFAFKSPLCSRLLYMFIAKTESSAMGGVDRNYQEYQLHHCFMKFTHFDLSVQVNVTLKGKLCCQIISHRLHSLKLYIICSVNFRYPLSFCCRKIQLDEDEYSSQLFELGIDEWITPASCLFRHDY